MQKPYTLLLSPMSFHISLTQNENNAVNKLDYSNIKYEKQGLSGNLIAKAIEFDAANRDSMITHATEASKVSEDQNNVILTGFSHLTPAKVNTVKDNFLEEKNK